MIFLLPAFTCPTMIDTLEAERAEYNFIDIDDSLLFEKEDLQEIIHRYGEENCALVATSLFGTELPNYKVMFPNAVIIEDRAQSLIEESSKANFQFTSFGKGKLVSGFGGGALKTEDKYLISEYHRLSVRNGFLSSYAMVLLNHIILKHFWFLVEILRLNRKGKHRSEKRGISRIADLKIRWILNSIRTLDTAHRRSITDYYLQNIRRKYLFDLKQNRPYLRMPVKKVIDIKGMGISRMEGYRYAYQNAVRKRGKELMGCRRLAFESSFLPTHDLVTLEHAKRITDAIT